MVEPVPDRMREHVRRWRAAEAELAQVRARELQRVDTRVAVRQLFGDNRLVQDAPRPRTSGLVEQQALFARLRPLR
jgi:hypothetical protein